MDKILSFFKLSFLVLSYCIFQLRTEFAHNNVFLLRSVQIHHLCKIIMTFLLRGAFYPTLPYIVVIDHRLVAERLRWLYIRWRAKYVLYVCPGHIIMYEYVRMNIDIMHID